MHRQRLDSIKLLEDLNMSSPQILQRLKNFFLDSHVHRVINITEKSRFNTMTNLSDDTLNQGPVSI